MEYTDKIEIHMGNYGNITLLENQLIPSSRNKQKITKSEVIERLRVLDIKDMNVSRTLYPFWGLLCSSKVDKCPKCGEPLAVKFEWFHYKNWDLAGIMTKIKWGYSG